MPDVVSAVPRYDIVVPRGATRVVRFVITKDGANVNGSLPGTWLVFTAKRRDDDVPLIQKAYQASGAVLPTGVVAGGIAVTQIDTNADSTPDTWVADVTVNPADTESVEEPLLHYDMWLRDPSGQEAPCAQGTLKLSPTVFRP